MHISQNARQTRARRSVSGPRTNRSANQNTPVEPWRLEAVLVSILQLVDDDNRLISPPFRLLDPPEEFPVYYEKIKNPIDLKMMAERIRSGKYFCWLDMETDIELMCKNAHEFNESGSIISKDAELLLNHYMEQASELAVCHKLENQELAENRKQIDDLLRSSYFEPNEFSEDSEEDEDSEMDKDPKWVIYWKIRNYGVINGVPTCEPFMELPSRRSYPDYYEEIKRPMSLFMINKKLKRGEYKFFNHFLDDLLLIFDNASTYNIEDSPIYKSAQALRKVVLDSVKEFGSSVSVSNKSEKDSISSDHLEDETHNRATIMYSKSPDPPEPFFVPSSDSLKTRRVLHSEAYVKYIESLHNKKQKTFGKWDTITSNSRNLSICNKKLPFYWHSVLRSEPKMQDDEVAHIFWRLWRQMLENDLGLNGQACSLIKQ